jgi:hypothetical protein
MMKLYKLTNESVKTLLNGVETDFDIVKSRYLDLRSRNFDLELDKLNCVEGGISFETISMVENEHPASDFENAKIIYSAFGSLITPEDADDSRLWVYLTHFTFFNYSRIRWAREGSSSETIVDRFFYKGNGRLSRTRNSIARLWWIPYLTFNPEGENDVEKWKYTRAAFSSQEVLVSLFERTLGSYSNIRKAFLDFIIENDPQGIAVQYLARKINNLGGVYLLPFLTENEVTEFLKTEYNIFNNLPN